MKKTSKYVSPDGLLTLVVVRESDDIALGFEGTPWHTHGDLLASEYGLPQEEAIGRFIEELTQNKAVIAVSSVHGVISDIWVVDDPAQSGPYKPDDEVIVFRSWNGTPFDPGNTIATG